MCIRHDAVLRHFDALLGEKLMTAMRASGVEVVDDAVPRRRCTAAPTATLRAQRADGRSARAVRHRALGHRPRAERRGPRARERRRRVSDAAGLHRRSIAYQNTSVPGVYAIGDVTGQAELTPVAIAAGRRLVGPRVRRHDGPPPRLRRDRRPWCSRIRRSAPSACRRRRRAALSRRAGRRSTRPSFVLDVLRADGAQAARTAMKLVCVGRRGAHRRLPRDRARRRRDDPGLRGGRDDGRDASATSTTRSRFTRRAPKSS